MCNLSTRTSVTYVPGLYTPPGEGVPLLESGVMQRSPIGSEVFKCLLSTMGDSWQTCRAYEVGDCECTVGAERKE